MHHCSEPTVQVLHENQSNFNFDSLDYEWIVIGCSPSMLAPLTLTPEIRGMDAVREEHRRKCCVLNAHKCVLLGKGSGLREVRIIIVVDLIDTAAI